MPEAVVLEPEIVVPELEAIEVVVHYNYKDEDSSTQDVAKTHMCLHQKSNDILSGSQFEHYELHILVIDY